MCVCVCVSKCIGDWNRFVQAETGRQEQRYRRWMVFKTDSVGKWEFKTVVCFAAAVTSLLLDHKSLFCQNNNVPRDKGFAVKTTLTVEVKENHKKRKHCFGKFETPRLLIVILSKNV